MPITPDTPGISTLDALADLPAAEWNALAGDDPFLSCEFLSALETSGCAVPKTGWRPQFLLAHEAGKLVGGIPLYLKSHSYGEYVFDWAWADAYARHGLAYYPKLLAAVPFTPITGTRILAQSDHIAEQLIHAALQLAKNLNVSSLHCLFPEAAQIPALQAAGMSVRHGVQFHWKNPDYPDFDAYLSGMNNEKRKKIKRERRRVRDAGISFEWILGHQATAAQWAFFFACYAQTYHAHNSTPYLNPDFFQRIAASMGEKILLVFAVREEKMIASAFNVFTRERLYGRYWGAMEQHSGLHFETCYYQAIEFCIAHRIAVFEGGAQGEHKLARGFLPEQTLSTHWLAHERLGRAVDDFLVREQAGMEHYANELNERSPFKQV